MTPNTVRKTLFAALAGSVAMLAPAAANATMTITNVTQDSGAVSGTILWKNPYNSSNTTVTAGIGRFTLTGTDSATNASTTFQSYCIDIFQGIANGAYTQSSLSSFLSLYDSATAATKANQLNALIANGNSKVVDATTSAAMQLAVWEIIYDYSSTTAYSVTMGNGAFYADSSSLNAARDVANSYLTSVTSGLWKTDSSYSLSVLSSGSLQDQLVFTRSTPSAVPETATWGMMVIGFGAMGGAMRRRRAVKTAVRFG